MGGCPRTPRPPRRHRQAVWLLRTTLAMARTSLTATSGLVSRLTAKGPRHPQAHRATVPMPRFSRSRPPTGLLRRMCSTTLTWLKPTLKPTGLLTPGLTWTVLLLLTTASSTDIGSNATTMSIYGVANKRAVNYKTAKSVPGGTASATSPGTTKSVAQLNIDVGAAFNAATPTAATVQAIRDVTNTIFAQAAQRYIAKISLAAHMPGNGMGGSSRFDQVITAPAKNPSKGYWQPGNWGIWKAADKAQATACGGDATQMPQAQEAPTGNTPGTYTKFSLQMNGGLACSKMTSGEGTVASNTATFKTVQPKVSQNGSGAGTTTATPTAVGTAVADACPTVSGIQAVKDCIVGSGAAGSPAPQSSL